MIGAFPFHHPGRMHVDVPVVPVRGRVALGAAAVRVLVVEAEREPSRAIDCALAIKGSTEITIQYGK